VGDVGCFSFFPTKNLGAFGDAGLVTSRRPDLAAEVRTLRVHGATKKYYHEKLGINSRLDAVQAAVLRVKLGRLDAWTARRQALAARYTAGLAAAGLLDTVRPQRVPEGFEPVWHQYTVRLLDRDRVQRFLADRGIGSTVYYPHPLHVLPAFQSLGYRSGDFPVAETLAREVLSLPMYPELRDDEVDRVVDTLAAFYRGAA
jgi:dTDP-4-amino-4,6-dideoxygalactose transaminase